MTKKAHFLENDEKLFFGRSRCDFHQTGWNFAQLSYFIFPLNETRNRLAIVHGCSALGVLGMVLRCKTPFHPPGQADTIIGHKCGYCYLKEHQKWGRTPNFQFIWLHSSWERWNLLSLSVLKRVFLWFINLSHRSQQDWSQMKWNFGVLPHFWSSFK